MLLGIVAAAEVWIGMICLSSFIYILTSFGKSSQLMGHRGIQYQAGLLLTCFSLMAVDCIVWYANGTCTSFARELLLWANTLLYCLDYLMGILYVCFVCTWLKDSRSVRLYRILSCTLCGTAILYALLNLRFHHLFFIDRAAYYHRGALFRSFIWFSYPVTAMHMLILFLHRKELSRNEYLSLNLYIIIPAVTVFLSAFWYIGISLPNIGFSLSAFLMFLILVQTRRRANLEQQARIVEQKEAFAEMQREMHDLQFRLAMSQVHPHFLYNCLNTIYYLCGKHPRTAQQAIRDFSDYLEYNTKSLTARTPITFSEELRHIRSYLSLENLRFDGELEVEYHVSTTGFYIPALSIQPLIENACEHGLWQKPGGGMLSLTTREDASHIYILVEDNGIGFNPNAVTGRRDSPHIGIENVRRRIETISGGSLHFLSVEGRGTSVKIILPKSRAVLYGETDREEGLL